MSKFHLNKGRYAAPQNSRYSAYIKERMIDGKDSVAVDSHDYFTDAKIPSFVIINLLACNSSDTFYLCNGPQSKVYHKTSHCQGLRRCSTDIETTDTL